MFKIKCVPGKVRDRSLFNSIYGGIAAQIIVSGAVSMMGRFNSMFSVFDGTLHSSGRNTYGQLGLGGTEDKNSFTNSGLTILGGIIGNSNGDSSLIMSGGTLHGCGRNTNGQLGLGDTFNKDVFTDTGISVDDTDKSVSIGTSSWIIKDGNVWSTGLNDKGQLGLGDLVNRNVFTDTGVSVDTGTGLSEDRLHKYQCIIKDGNVWSVGSNDKGQLGLGDLVNRNVFTDTGVSVDTGTGIKSSYNSTWIIKNGTLWSTGLNDDGQLGLGDTVQRTSFTDTGFSLDSIDNLYFDSFYSIYVIKDGNIWVVGKNFLGQLGLGTDLSDRLVFEDTGFTIDSGTVIATGRYCCFAIKNGTIWSTGHNADGTLGLGDSVNRNIFTDTGVPILDGVVYSNFETSVFLKSDSVNSKSTGHNFYGTLGVGDNAVKQVFTAVSVV